MMRKPMVIWDATQEEVSRNPGKGMGDLVRFFSARFETARMKREEATPLQPIRLPVPTRTYLRPVWA